MTKKTLYLNLLFTLFLVLPVCAKDFRQALVKGKITGADNEELSYVTVYLKDTLIGTSSNAGGIYELNAPAGTYILVARMIGYEIFE